MNDLNGNLKIIFQDQGQDLLWVIIDTAKLIVVSAGELKSNELFAGAEVRSEKILENGFLEVFHHEYGFCLIKYPIEKLEPVTQTHK